MTVSQTKVVETWAIEGQCSSADCTAHQHGEWYTRESLGSVGETEAVRIFQMYVASYPNSRYRLVMEKSTITYSRVTMACSAMLPSA